MEINYNQIMILSDAIDEFIYSNPGLLDNPDSLVKCHLASTNHSARRFINTYKQSPNKGLLYLICDHYHPTCITTGHLKQSVPTNLSKAVDFINGVIKTFNEHHNHYYIPPKSANATCEM